ncbi:MAG: gamma-glutamylcyclotransferase family protein [Actinomycetota bacterium]
MTAASVHRPFFVYGTLRREQGNYRLLRGRTVSEHPATLPGYALHAAGLPYVVAAGADDLVVGELMFVRPSHYAEILGTLDQLEGCTLGRPGLYERIAASARYRLGGQDRAVEAWVYLAGDHFRPSPTSLVASGDWLGGRRLRPALR